MKYSMVVCTIDRPHCLGRLLASLAQQIYVDFEIIIIDQSESSQTRIMVEQFHRLNSEISIHYKNITTKGLSHARNVGLKLCSGDIICFPDDDCEYRDENILLNVVNHFNTASVDMVSIMLKDLDKNIKYNTSFPDVSVKIDFYNIYKTVTSATLFIKVKDLYDIHFDNNIGVGKYLSSGEETIMLYELLLKKYSGMYFPTPIIHHPVSNNDSIDDVLINKYYIRARGRGATVWHMRAFTLWYVYQLYFNFVRPLLGILISKGRKRQLYRKVLKGRIEGVKYYKKYQE